MPTPTTPKPLAAIVYMDYDNIQDFLSQYGTDPFTINLFPVILAKFKKNRFKILDFIAYGNFERKPLSAKQQTYLCSLGLQTRHSSYQGKNSSELELTVDALMSLFKTPGIDLYILITNGRDMIPLLKTIRLEGKLSYILTSRNGFNKTVAEYADYHEYLENLLGLGEPCRPPMNPTDILPDLDLSAYKKTDIDRARQVAQLFYRSHIWRRAVQLNEPVNLYGYTQAIAKTVSRLSTDILNDFHLAHALKFVTIYPGPNQNLFIKEGAKKEECGS